MSRAEFQTIYVDALPSRRWSWTPAFLSVGFLRTMQSGKGGGSSLSVEKPEKHSLSQVVTGNLNSRKSWEQYEPLR